MPGGLPLSFSAGLARTRTGLVAAAILSSIGVPDETVVDAYAMSADSLGSLYNAWARQSNSTIEQALQPSHMSWGAPVKRWLRCLRRVSQEFGSMRRYLKAQGAHASLFEALEPRLLA